MVEQDNDPALGIGSGVGVSRASRGVQVGVGGSAGVAMVGQQTHELGAVGIPSTSFVWHSQ